MLRSTMRMHRHLLSDSLTLEPNNNNLFDNMRFSMDSKLQEEGASTQGDELRRLKTSRSRFTRSATTGLLL